MKKSIPAILLAGLTLSACLPAFLQSPSAAPTVDTQATISAGLTGTSAAQAPLATATATATRRIEQTATSTASPTETATETPTATTTVDATGTFGTPVDGLALTPTNVTGTPGTPGVLIVATSSGGSATATLGAQFYGTQPPDLPFGRLTLINKAKAEAYVSIQCTTRDGQTSILEYPVPKRVKVRVPAGSCSYVAWVGGRKMSGSFHLGVGSEKTLTLYKDRIAIK
jgi:hypothetical protein